MYWVERLYYYKKYRVWEKQEPHTIFDHNIGIMVRNFSYVFMSPVSYTDSSVGRTIVSIMVLVGDLSIPSKCCGVTSVYRFP
jgi:hypothetical protein